MNWKAVLCALCVSVSVAGCGGGGGGGGSDFVPTPSSDPIAAVRVREAALGNAIASKDINRIMGFYSESYSDNRGNSKADIRDNYVAFFQAADIVSTTTTINDLYTIADNGNVISGSAGSLTFRIKDTGEIFTINAVSASAWRNENGTWRILSSQSDLQAMMNQKRNPL
jgi:ketosteroid isomerase-like protein